eukprot:COSAG05_NODE_3498_length_2026_cov_1.513752_1_plen_76_part_00
MARMAQGIMHVNMSMSNRTGSGGAQVQVHKPGHGQAVVYALVTRLIIAGPLRCSELVPAPPHPRRGCGLLRLRTG